MTDMTQTPGPQLPVARSQEDVKAAQAEFSGGIHTGMALPALSVRGKEFRVRWQGQERTLGGARDLEVLVVAARPNISKRFYKTRYQQGSVEAPDCFSIDGNRPDQSAAEPQCTTCGQCPHNQFGSRITESGGKGKACNDYKRLVVLPFLGGKPFDTPVVLDVPATSLKTPKGYQGQAMFMREYFGMLAKHGCTPMDVGTKLQFTDAEYPQISFAFARNLSAEEYQLGQGWRTHEDVRSVLDMDEHEGVPSGQAAEIPAPAQEVPRKPAQPAQEAVQPAPAQPAPAQPAQEAAQPAPAQPAPAQPAQEAAQPAPAQPAQEAAQETAQSSDDAAVLSEVEELLKGFN